MFAGPVIAFDIETIPDLAGLRALRGAGRELTDTEVYAAEIEERKARGKGDFMPHHLQRVLVVSCVYRGPRGLFIRSFADPSPPGQSREAEVIQAFFDRIDDHAPQLVSWNGGGFDLPVLQQRALRHGITARGYWDMGDDDRERRYNHYISRYHTRHLDLMDILALYSGRANAPLDAMAKLCGFPGKLGMDGSQVWPAYLEGRTDEVRRYCETDALNTYLLYCRFELMRGNLTAAQYANEVALARDTVAGLAEPHWAEYLAAWPADDVASRLAGEAGPLDMAPSASRDAAPSVEPDATHAAPATALATGDVAVAAVVESTTTTTTTTVYIEDSSIRT